MPNPPGPAEPVKIVELTQRPKPIPPAKKTVK
jgi:hypothetical protein